MKRFWINIRNAKYKLQFIMYAQFCRIYFAQMFNSNFKLFPSIEVFYSGEYNELTKTGEHIVKAGLHHNENIFYHKKTSSLVIINDWDAVEQFCNYKITFYNNI